MNAEKRKQFLARWIPYGMKMLTRAEAHGIDWTNIPMEKLEASIIMAEEWSTPDEYKDSFQHQRRNHG